MATYAIGDIHGCFVELQLLLKKCAFDSSKDKLWFTGDLINGGPQSIETMEFIKNLKENAIWVLGNHDLTLLGVAAGKISLSLEQGIDFAKILADPRAPELIEWLHTGKVMHYDKEFNVSLVHAGVAPAWSITKALTLASELETVLQDKKQAPIFFANMFGNEPAVWSDALTGWDRIRCITNYFTRLRFCDQDGKMDLHVKGSIAEAPPTMQPWFKVPTRKSRGTRILFGHWAALMGNTSQDDNVVALDTGCVWGNYLSAIRLEDHCMFRVKSLSARL